MFNGIIFNKGKITNITKRAKGINVFIKSKLKLTNKQLGISISCDGVCLTLISYNKGISEFYLSNETIRKSKFKNKNAKLIFMKIENNSFDLNTILKKIYSLGYANLLLESGPNLLKSFLNNNLINDFYLFKADNKINLKNSVALNSFIDLLSKKFKKRSQINTFLDKEKLFRYQ